MAARNTLVTAVAQFLRSGGARQGTALKAESLCFVLGNQSADADSIVSSIVLAFSLSAQVHILGLCLPD